MPKATKDKTQVASTKLRTKQITKAAKMPAKATKAVVEAVEEVTVKETAMPKGMGSRVNQEKWVDENGM
mgnify:CR=1 FL=1